MSFPPSIWAISSSGDYLPCIGGVLPNEDFQERAFPSPSFGDEGYFLVFVDPERHIFEEHPLPIGFGYVFYRKIVQLVNG